MAKTLLTVKGLHKSFGGVTATDHVGLDVAEGEIHAVIGPNGAGKTTLVSQLSGELRPDSGTVEYDGELITLLAPHARSHLGISRSFQITSLMLDMSVRDNVALAVQAHAGHSFRLWGDARRDTDLIEPAMASLEQVGLMDRADAIAREISHGEHRLLEIAMALATKPRLLLLDEPMAGMGVEEAQRMIGFLASLKGEKSMLLVEHDMDAVFALADRITVLVTGKVIASGPPDQIRGDPEVRRAYLGDEASASAEGAA
ncbi:MAG: ABC transporter ATP-binding protein [Alphaproteobacteria bacterium]|nr:ABC transporter ATP-binding protein [Alphaproteobacteria bacterium]